MMSTLERSQYKRNLYDIHNVQTTSLRHPQRTNYVLKRLMFILGKFKSKNIVKNSPYSLACHCAAKAKEGGYVAIALGYYGECHATKDQSKFDQLTHSPSSVSNKCVNHGFGKCKDTDTKCIGKERATYVYDFPSQAPEGMFDVYT